MPSKVPGYRLGSSLGVGKSTVVYRGMQERSGRVVALRLLATQAAGQPEAVRRFENGATLSQRIDHPSVVRCLELTKAEDGRPCAVMEYVPGVTLAHTLAALAEHGRRVPQTLSLQLVDALLAALDYVHNIRDPKRGTPLGIVHRDLTPDNIMLSFAGVPKLLDFRSARADLGQDRTAAGYLLGTPRYMSPEQLLSEQDLDARTDVYGMGAVLFELLSGRPLLSEQPPAQLMQALLTLTVPRLEPEHPELGGIDAVLGRALAKRVEHRYPHAEAFRAALAPIAARLPTVAGADWAELLADLFPEASRAERKFALRAAEDSAPPPPPRPRPARAPPPRPPSKEKPEKPKPTPPELPGYTILGPIAEGGMASVWMARRSGARERVVIKLLLPQYQTHRNVEARFLREAKIMTLLQHDNVAQVVDAGRDKKQRFFLVMEFLAGVDFEAMIFASIKRREPMPAEVALGIVRGALAGLDHAHEQIDPQTQKPAGIVHRDLSGRNVMITFDGETKVIDFGLARLRAAGQESMTRAGAVLGTLRYMSPEQATGDARLDRRSDIYAIGVLLHEALTARPLVNGRIAEEVTPQILKDKPRPPSELVAGLPPALDAVVLRALAKRPEERFDRASSFKRALEEAAPGLCPADPAPRVADYVQRFAPEAHAKHLAQIDADQEISMFDDGPATPAVATPLLELPITRPAQDNRVSWLPWIALAFSVLALLIAVLMRGLS